MVVRIAGPAKPTGFERSDCGYAPFGVKGMYPVCGKRMTEPLQLYFDDSGSRYPDHVERVRRDGMDYFAFGGVLVKQEEAGEFVKIHREFCKRWGLDYPLHSTKIRGQKKEFSWLGKDEVRKSAFYNELSQLIVSLPYVAIACVIDRKGYNARYHEKFSGHPWMLCRTAFAIMIERAAKHADRQGRKLEVYFEGAGKQEDRDIVSYCRELKLSGMPFDKGSSSSYEGLSPEDFKRILIGEPRRKTKESPMCQIADLVLYAIAKGKYAPDYSPFNELKQAGKLIDCHLHPDELSSRGIKYSCFDL